MATINYNGMELEEVTTPQIFDPPKRMLVWDNSANIKIGIVAAILPGVGFPVTTIDEDGIIQAFHLHCAEITDPPKPRRATNRELARWLAQGKGEWRYGDSDRVHANIGFGYDCNKQHEIVDEKVKICKWSDTEWHEPTVDYMGLEDVK